MIHQDKKVLKIDFFHLRLREMRSDFNAGSRKEILYLYFYNMDTIHTCGTYLI